MNPVDHLRAQKMPRQVGLLVLLLLLVVPCVLAADANLTRLSLVDFVATGAVGA